MTDIVIFGGTSEGRMLAEFCHRHQIQTVVSVASDYGMGLLPVDGSVTAAVHRLNQEEMVQWLEEQSPKLVLDATHPFAAEVSRHAKTACARLGISYRRVLREEEPSGRDGLTVVDSVSQAVEYLKETKGAILVTTGSKELARFTELADYKNRIYPRILPDGNAVEHCLQLGIPGSHIIAMQGPFSTEMNVALLHQIGADYLVTKESGPAGGFGEKLEAAAACGVQAVVIGRPKEAEGISMEEAYEVLRPFGQEKRAEEKEAETIKKQVYFMGIGMGGPGQMTEAVREAMSRCQVLLGAPRMLKSIDAEHPDISDIPKIPIYLTDAVLDFLNTTDYERIGILYSGDTGYYSGASGLCRCLQEKESNGNEGVQVTVFPGISSLAYFCSRLQTPWQDVCSVSMHGRAGGLEQALKSHSRVFVLLGGEYTVTWLCKWLMETGYSGIRMQVGEHLSYPEERIRTGGPGELIRETFDGLAVALLEQGEEDHT